MRIRLIAAAHLALVLVAAFAVPASAAPVNTTVTAWTWNVAGWKMHRGSTTNGLIPVLADSIRNRGAGFAALNELCWQQYKAVQANLRASGWPEDVENFSRFEAHNDTHCDGKPFGVAIFSKAPLGPADRYALADDGTSERRKLLCASLEKRPRLRFCTTHITPRNDLVAGRGINTVQLGEVLARLEAYEASGDTVVIAGDFNAQPHYARLNGWYSAALDVPNNSGNTGAYRELDDTDSRCPGYGEVTTTGTPAGPCGPDKKLDLIFVRANHLRGGYDGDSLTISTACGGPCSDHRILVGTVTVSGQT